MKSIFHALNRLKVFRGLTEQEFAWVLYDVGNSAFTMLSCSLIPIWFKSLAIGTAPGQINCIRQRRIIPSPWRSSPLSWRF